MITTKEMKHLKISLLLLCLLFAIRTSAQIPIPKHEVRAVWLTTIGGLDWPHNYAQSERSARKQQQELCDILDQLQAAHVNTVLLQTRIRATTLYPSAMEPWDGCLSGFPGKSPGYDALQFAIQECHRRGMELHAWIVTIPVGRWNATGCKQLRTRYPNMIRKIGDEGFMNPEQPETADYLARMCQEITRDYDIDGIHLDYIRYPETWTIKVSREQGRKNITRIVQKIHHAVKALKPWVKMSCSPVGKFDDLSRYWSHGWNAYTTVCQDAQGWLRDGLMDELFPMMYFKGDQFFPFAIDWQENSYGRIVAPGLGIYFMSSKEKDWPVDIIQREIHVLRHYGLGHAYFRSKFFTDNIKGIFTLAQEETDPYPALVPPMTWASQAIPQAPQTLDIKRTQQGDLLSWRGAKDRSDGPYLSYHVYASTSSPVNTNDARLLVAVGLRDSQLYVPAGREQLHYAVTAVDRYGNESRPIMTQDKQGPTSLPLLENDGHRLLLPEKGPVLDASHILIEDLQERILSTQTYNGTRADISHLPDGMYLIRSLNRKGVSHRLGHFIKKTYDSEK